MSQIKVLVSCGSGIATSKLVAYKVSSFLEEKGYKAVVDTCAVSELAAKHANYDVLLTTAFGDFGLTKPVINAVPFITGISISKAQEELVNEIESLLNK